ncbi:TetR/AcrR family transcriptional regulator [Streptomyces sp. NPDC003691]
MERDGVAGGKPRGDTARNVWLWPERTPRGQPPLTLDRIAAAAVVLLDEQGIDRLTMRRLAERLDVVAPSLYWHIDNKDNVIDLALDAVFGEPPGRAGEADVCWRDRVTGVMSGIRATLVRHPWATAALTSRPPSVGPNFLAWLETLQTSLARAGLPDKELTAATWTLFNHVMGFAWSESTGRVTAEQRDAGREHLRDNRHRYPTLASNDSLYCGGWDGMFSIGVRYLLDGIGTRLRIAEQE